MGLFMNLVSFGAGYAAGAKVGTRPVESVRTALSGSKERAATVAQQARELTSRLKSSAASSPSTPVPGGSVDVRDVREVMTAAPETVETTSGIRDAARALERADIGSVIVVEDGQVRGILTDRDIALRVVAAGLDPSTAKVVDAMTAAPETIAPNASVQEAVSIMRQHDIRRLPVVESGRPIGVVALADLATSSQMPELLSDISSAPPNN
jgi:CBS domain-containing protein